MNTSIRRRTVTRSRMTRLAVVALLAFGATAIPAGAADAATARCMYLETTVGYPYITKIPATTDGIRTVPCYLSQGMTDTATGGPIRELNFALQRCNLQSPLILATYGSSTVTAIKNVQRAAGLTADGVYGPQTRAAMKWPRYNWNYEWDGTCLRL